MIYRDIQKLIEYAITHNLIKREDEIVIRNAFIEVLRLNEWVENDVKYNGEKIDDVLAPLVQYACDNGIINDTTNSRDLFDTKLMGILTPLPSKVNTIFEINYNENPKKATDEYFDFCKNLNYVRAGRIEKDLKWTYECEYGVLDITVNCSKPEKDPRDIAAAKSQVSVSYPKCQLCPENAGFTGHATHPARQNLRPINIRVNDEPWQFQYSPYGYYNEHSIFFNNKHIPMVIDKAVFNKLLDIINYLPHYFVGSNADLPIVGGSILSHEHFQGGKYTFAMETAPIEKEFSLQKFKNVKAGIVKWPMSVIRISSKNRDELTECADHILNKWRGYNDSSVGIYANTDNTPHNTVTPIARKRGEKYELDLVLRNNLTSEDRPLGIFHPNPSLHHIKKENIGLIEVMGLAVLPSRLSKEIVLLEEAMLGDKNFDSPELSQHSAWAKEVLLRHPELSKDNVRAIIEDEIGKVFLEVLHDAGVFKRNSAGAEAFTKFINSL